MSVSRIIASQEGDGSGQDRVRRRGDLQGMEIRPPASYERSEPSGRTTRVDTPNGTLALSRQRPSTIETSTSTLPRGVGTDPHNCVNGPGCGAISSLAKPGAAGLTP